MRIQRLIGGFCLLGLLSVVAMAAGNEVADAVMNKNAAAVKSLLSQKADVNAPQTDGATALHWAVKWDDAAMVDQLIRAGANVNAANRVGATPMYLAAVNGNPVIIERLLAAGVDPNAPLLSAKETALMVAARTGKPEAVKVLLDRGAQVNATESLRGTTALMWAAEQGHADTVKLLAARGADLSATSKRVLPPANRRAPVVDEEDDSPTGVTGALTALALAAREGKIDAVKALVEAGADVNQTTGDKTSPLEIAILNGNYDIAVYLLDRKADPNLSNARGWNPLYQTVKNRNLETGAVPLMKVGVLTDELELMKILLAHGADPNIRMKANSQSRNGQGGTWMDENGATPFLRASMNGDVEVMKLLLRAGSDPNLESVDGTTPLMALAGVGYAEGFISHHSERETMEAFNLLLNLGADINARKRSGRFKGMTALHGAAHRGDNSVLKALVDLGAPIDVLDDTRQSEGAKIPGLTPLDWAIGVRISVASPVYKDSTVELLKQMYAERGMPLPANALGTVGGKRSAAGTGVKEEKK